MSYAEYRQFRSEVHRLYLAGEYSAALDKLDLSAHLYPEQAARLQYIRVCLLALCSPAPAALAALQQAIEWGYWYPPAYLRNDPDLAALQGQPEFERLIAVCAERFERAAQAARPGRIVLLPPTATPAPFPLLLVFHGRNADATSMLPFWDNVAERGWLVALAQSSQVVGVDSYAWDDLPRAIQEARQHFDELSGGYPLHDQRLILAGFSQGAGLALELALKQILPASGFIAVAPYLHTVAELLKQPSDRPARQLRGYLLAGDLDGHQEMFTQIEQLLKMRQVCYRREQRAALDHDFPTDFEASLDQALPFILGE